MNYLKNIGISLIYNIGCLVVLTFLLTVFNYFDIINGGLFTFFMIFNFVFSVFLGSILFGRNFLSNGWFEGLKYGFIFLCIISVFDYFLLSFHFNFKFLVFSIIILFSSVLGGMVGINFKKKK